MPRSSQFASAFALATVLLGAALPAVAQDYDAMIWRALQRQQATVDGATRNVQGAVQQRMRDPQVQAAYRQYVGRVQQAGVRPIDFPTYTYQWIYTAGFSPAGVRLARQNEAAITQREAASLQSLRRAQAARGQAQQTQRDHYVAGQQEAGRGLMGQSTYVAQNGATTVLPHTWAADSLHDWQGRTYRVDVSGSYTVLASDGRWMPLAPAR